MQAVPEMLEVVPSGWNKGKALQALLVGLHAPGRLGMVLDQVQGLPVPAAGLEFQLS